MVGLILNTYKREKIFEEQLAAVRSQSVPPDKLIVWRNADQIPDEKFKGVDYVKASKNMGVWARLSLARDLRTDFVCVIDDDTIPGNKWLETCLKLYSEKPAMYCAHGFRFKGIKTFNEKNFHDREQFGPFNKKPYTVDIDWGGHGLFFSREVLLKSLSIERVHTNTAGEDAHLAFSAQQLGLKTTVTPYPEDSSVWGSLKAAQGNDKHATHRLVGQRQNMITALNFYRERGWKFETDPDINGVLS